MVESTFTTSPTCTKVLIIGNSKYKEESKLDSLTQPKNDAEEFKKTCIELLKIKPEDIHMFIDQKSKSITDTYNFHFKSRAIALCDTLDDKGVPKISHEYGQFIIFYSGHGKIFDARTMGIDQEGENIDIEKFVTDIGCR